MPSVANVMIFPHVQGNPTQSPHLHASLYKALGQNWHDTDGQLGCSARTRFNERANDGSISAGRTNVSTHTKYVVQITLPPPLNSVLKLEVEGATDAVLYECVWESVGDFDESL